MPALVAVFALAFTPPLAPSMLQLNVRTVSARTTLHMGTGGDDDAELQANRATLEQMFSLDTADSRPLGFGGASRPRGFLDVVDMASGQEPSVEAANRWEVLKEADTEEMMQRYLQTHLQYLVHGREGVTAGSSLFRFERYSADAAWPPAVINDMAAGAAVADVGSRGFGFLGGLISSVGIGFAAIFAALWVIGEIEQTTSAAHTTDVSEAVYDARTHTYYQARELEWLKAHLPDGEVPDAQEAYAMWSATGQ